MTCSSVPAAVTWRRAPGARPEVDDVVRGAQRLLVVLHHDQGVPQVPQVTQRVQQALVVALVQADGGLVENVQHPHQRGADLGRQADALRLAAGQRRRPPVPGVRYSRPTLAMNDSRSRTSFRIWAAICRSVSFRFTREKKSAACCTLMRETWSMLQPLGAGIEGDRQRLGAAGHRCRSDSRAGACTATATP